jgi:hypothetical protein
MSTLDRQLTQREGSLSDLVTLLREQHIAKLDVVIPAAGIRSSGGRWQIEGTGSAVLGPDGVTTGPGTFVPTGIDAWIAELIDSKAGLAAPVLASCKVSCMEVARSCDGVDTADQRCAASDAVEH